MTKTNLPEDDPRTRVRQLLDQITVTALESGNRLGHQAKLGRVIAACRGHVSALVSINWGSTSPDAVRTALDALRGAE